MHHFMTLASTESIEEEKDHPSKKDESYTTRKPKREQKRLLLGMDAVPILVV